MPLDVRTVTRAEAIAADEMWLSSSTKEVLAITTVDGAPFGGGTPGPVFRRVWQAFQASKPQASRHEACLTHATFAPASGVTPPNPPWWNTSPLPRARSTVTTSPMNTTWSPAAMPRVVAAFEPGDAALDQRRVGPAEPVRDAREAVGVRPRESPRELDLLGRRAR